MGTQGLDGLAIPPYDDSLLRLTLDEERDSNVHGALGFAKLLHLRGKGIRHLILEQRERGLAQVLDHEEAQRLGPDLFGVELKLSRGKQRPEPSEEAIESLVP